MTLVRRLSAGARTALYGVGLIVALMFGVAYGPTPLSVAAIVHALLHPYARSVAAVIVWQIRLPRVLAAGAVGGALATAGTVMQSLLQNPLADPYVVGASSGAGLGAIIAGLLVPGFAAVPLGAFLGALTAVWVAWTIARGRDRVSMLSLILAGYALGVLFSAIGTFLLIEHQTSLATIFAWELGGIHGLTWRPLAVATVIIALATGMILPRIPELNALLLGDEVAHGVGVALGRTQTTLLLAASLLTAASVYLAGLIGFVGLVIPHLIRRLSGPEHQRLIPYGFITGAIFLVLADTLAERLPPVGTVPVGLVTAVLGAPYFLFLLARRGRFI